jgi:hypothetical protein
VSPAVQAALVGLGAVLCALQALSLFVITDLRDRIVRLENQRMGVAGD